MSSRPSNASLAAVFAISTGLFLGGAFNCKAVQPTEGVLVKAQKSAGVQPDKFLFMAEGLAGMVYASILARRNSKNNGPTV